MPDPVQQKLMDVLDAEKAAIISADYERLDGLSREKGHIFEMFIKAGPTPAETRQVHGMLLANQTLMASAITGVKTARKRIEELKTVAETLGVYDQSGQMAKVATQSRDLEKKA